MLSNQLKKPATAREIILAIVGMVLVVYLSYNNYYIPKRAEGDGLAQSLKEVQEKITGLKKLNAVLQQKKNQADQQNAVAPTVNESQDVRVQMFQRNKKQKYENITAFFKELTSPLFRSGVTLDSMKYDASQKRAGYVATKFSFVAHGNFTKVMLFLKKIQDNSALVALDAINFSVTNGESDAVSLSIAGEFYQLEDENG